jgi:hypothetical protein
MSLRGASLLPFWVSTFPGEDHEGVTFVAHCSGYAPQVREHATNDERLVLKPAFEVCIVAQGIEPMLGSDFVLGVRLQHTGPIAQWAGALDLEPTGRFTDSRECTLSVPGDGTYRIRWLATARSASSASWVELRAEATEVTLRRGPGVQRIELRVPLLRSTR